MRMPGFRRAILGAKCQPDIPGISTSAAGISQQVWNDSKEKPVGAYFIQKPFRLEELKALLMAILSE